MEEKLKTSKGLKQKILLVEGNNINRRIMRELLKKMNLDITEAKDGLEAIELAKKESFDMIFMDIFMPGMNGQETINRIRELDDFSREIPIIAVTANYDEETQEKIMAMG